MFNLWIYYYTFLIVIHSFRHFIIINNLMINRVVRHKFSVRWWRWPMLVENVSHLFGPVFLTKCAQDERSVSDMQSSCAYTSSCCMLPHSHAHSLSLSLSMLLIRHPVSVSHGVTVVCLPFYVLKFMKLYFASGIVGVYIVTKNCCVRNIYVCGVRYTMFYECVKTS